MRWLRLGCAVCWLVGAAWAAEPAAEPTTEPVTKPTTVVATPGEGIYGLLRRHGIQPTPANLEAFIQLNQSLLGPGQTLRRGHEYRLPESPTDEERTEASKGSRTRHALFGPEYAWVERRDNALAKGVFYLVSGHGGPDPGALGRREGHTLSEDEYAYDITLRLARALIEHGATAYVIVRDKNDGIRDTRWLAPDHDEVAYPSQPIPLNQMARLRQRADAVNRLYEKRPAPGLYHRVVIIHVDSRQQDNRVDVFFYHHQASALGKRLAMTLREVFETNYRRHQPGRGYRGSVSSRSLYMLNATAPPAVFIELGNIRNPNNQYRFIDPENRQALAEWIAAGIIKDYRVEHPVEHPEQAGR